MEIFLARHGETEYNRTNRIMGQMGVPINEKGVEQAKKLASALEGKGINVIHSSDLTRATETTEIICEKLNLPFVMHEELREHGVGKLEGVTWAVEFEDMTLNDFDDLMAREGGEGTKVFLERVWKVFLNIINNHNHEDKILILTHGGCIRAILMKLFQSNEEIFGLLSQGNCCLNLIHYNKNAKNQKFQIVYLNNCSHLDM